MPENRLAKYPSNTKNMIHPDRCNLPDLVARNVHVGHRAASDVPTFAL